jgi:hypothetical protein
MDINDFGDIAHRISGDCPSEGIDLIGFIIEREDLKEFLVVAASEFASVEAVLTDRKLNLTPDHVRDLTSTVNFGKTIIKLMATYGKFTSSELESKINEVFGSSNNKGVEVPFIHINKSGDEIDPTMRDAMGDKGT